jgi:cobalamin biosynthesis protein CobD/CbiB
MSLFSLLAVLLLEQARPLPYRRFVHGPLSWFSSCLESGFNAGQRRHGTIAWLVGVGGLVLVAVGAYFVLADISPLLAWLWNVLVLYLTMGIRQFSPYSTGIHRYGHSSAFLADCWGRRDAAEDGDFGSFARRSFAIIDWLRVRPTAAASTLVGDFEDAVYCWRTQAERWPGDGPAIVLAGSGAGALGVRLGMPPPASGEPAGWAAIGTGEAADVLTSWTVPSGCFGVPWCCCSCCCWGLPVW